ncbi:hypothetical protein BVRB_9g220090 [Beta vulgaris subsp. vulgaris]|nr:hypothetical protein BVRB_9g220090 [Beta vulgaris subsp. vulgaris]
MSLDPAGYGASLGPMEAGNRLNWPFPIWLDHEL